MNKFLLICLLKGVAGMIVAHAVVAMIGDETFFSKGLVISIITGIPVGYLIYRAERKFRNGRP